MAESGEATKPEIEKFLLAKLQAGIDRKVPRSGKFKMMKEMLEKQLESAPDEKAKGRIRERLYLLNNLMNKYNSKFDYFSWSLHSGLKQLKKDIQSAPKKGADGEDGGNRGAAAASAERSTRTMAMDKAEGLEADELSVMNLLLYQSGIRCEVFNAVGIIGAEGVGKTTLAQSIFAKEEVAERFLPRIWISMAEDPAEEEENLQMAIAKRILLALGISDEAIENIRQSGSDNHLAALIHAIRLELMGKRYLIVLDDASMKDLYSELSPNDKLMKEWYRNLSAEPTPKSKLEEKLGFAFPKGSGGTVLVVGWPEHVVKAMLEGDGSAIHRLLPLEDPKLCWEICKDEAGGEAGIRDDTQKVEAEVVKRSNGLPAAARLMGKIVKKKNDQQTQAIQPIGANV